MDRDSRTMHGKGFRLLHWDKPFKVTWVNGSDIPQPTPKRSLTRDQFIAELAQNHNVNIT